MRHLTIKRTKSFVGCLAKLRLYIEDATANDLTINGVSCRKLGEIKNGEEKTFEIGEEASKVFVIGDKLSKGFCNDYYPLPAGQEDVSLTGKNCYNPASGNAFRFDGNFDPQVLENRKKSTRRGMVVLAISLVAGFALGFFLSSDLFASLTAQPKEFSGNGISLTLTSEFEEDAMAGYESFYASSRVAVYVSKQDFASLEGLADCTAEQYRDLFAESNGYTVTPFAKDGLVGFERPFTLPKTGEEYYCFSYIHKTGDAFWMVQFVTFAEDAENRREDVTNWAKSVQIG